jgi:hypothetical protein
MTRFKLAVLAVLLAVSGSALAVDAPADPEKLRAEFVKVTTENADLKKRVQELMLAKAKCEHVVDQVSRSAKDD